MDRRGHYRDCSFMRIAGFFALRSGLPQIIGEVLYSRPDVLMAGCLLALVCANEELSARVRAMVRSPLIPVSVPVLIVIEASLGHRFGGYYYATIGWSLRNLVLVLCIAHLVWHESTLRRV